MFTREYGLVPNQGDTERYVRLVKWEPGWHVTGPDTEEKHVLPTVWELTMLDVSNPRLYDYAGPVFKLVPTAITELPMRSLVHYWPSDASTENEDLRRERIRTLRRACHVDELLGWDEPAWMPDVGPEGHRLHTSAGTISAAA